MPVRLGRLPRSGFTLLELVVALALFTIVATLMLGIVQGQQRFHLGVLEIVDTKRSVRQAVALLYGDVKAASASDIYAISDTSITLRVTRGASYACGIDSTRVALTLPAIARAGTGGLTSILAMPRAGDSILIFDPGETPTPDDDRWHPHTLTADPGSAACPVRPLGIAASDAESAGIGIAVAPSIPQTVPLGAPIRFFIPARYALYRGTSGWMLGYSACPRGACGARQPLSGPYLPFAAGTAPGLALRYFDTLSAEMADPRRIARIDVVARARSPSILDVAHVRGQRYQDSLAMTIALRNRS